MFGHADSTYNKQGNQGNEFHSVGGVCQPYLNAVVVVRCFGSPPRFPRWVERVNQCNSLENGGSL